MKEKNETLRKVLQSAYQEYMKNKRYESPDPQVEKLRKVLRAAEAENR